MRLGILNAIHPDESQVNWGGSPVDAYIRYFEEAAGRAGVSIEYTGYQVAQGQLPESPNACDAYVVTGSPKGVYDDDPWIAELAQFLRDCYAAGKKLIGICFGHQILAEALGGHSQKSEKGWGLGQRTFQVSGRKAWMNGQDGALNLYFAHQDQVTSLPPGAELLGGNDFCPIGFYAIGDQVMAIQGHPEFTPEIMADILQRKEGHIDEQVFQAAARSLDNGQADGQKVGRWMVDFLTAAS
jgi:GMP synthase-like glutamine amidotransferase